MKKTYYVYIMTNRNNTVLYTGVTSNLLRRVEEHKHGVGGAFSKKYKLCKLLYYREFSEVRDAINEEKRIKGGSRRKKIELIQSVNPKWVDLSEAG
ncbi:GIY-YIG nuclease family protein [bacterium]|nr:GIY-YIG nuclease family protein [bacterium]